MAMAIGRRVSMTGYDSPAVVQGAVRQVEVSQEVPHVRVGPIQDGIHTHDGGPAHRGGGKRLQGACMRGTSPSEGGGGTRGKTQGTTQ
jgi:hypothetical protein